MSLKYSTTTADYLVWSDAMNLIRKLAKDGNYKMSLLIALGCFTGLRISDILALRWEQILSTEEFIFRGAVQQTCAKWFGNHHWAILLTAAVFSIIHFDLFNFMPRFLMGLLLGYIFYYSGTIWASIMAHFTNNALVVLIYHFFGAESVKISTPGQVNVWLILVGVVLTSLIAYFFVKTSKKLK